jgi:hypothetical protein
MNQFNNVHTLIDDKGKMRLVVDNCRQYNRLMEAIAEKKSLVLYQFSYFDWKVANIDIYGRYDERKGNYVLEQGRYLMHYFRVGGRLVARVKKFEIYTKSNIITLNPPLLKD